MFASERDINLLCNDLRGKRIRHQLLHTSHAFHSDMMQSAEPGLRALLSAIDATNAHTPIISCFTGKPANNADLRDPDFWLTQLTATVQFADGAAQLPEFAQCAVIYASSAVADLVPQNRRACCRQRIFGIQRRTAPQRQTPKATHFWRV